MIDFDEEWLERYNDLIMQGVDCDQAECDASDYVEQLMQEDKLDRADFEYNRRIDDGL